MSDQSSTEAAATTEGEAEPQAPEPCTVCRGTGKVLSNLGGTLKELECPWCEGSGVFLPEHDAQGSGAEPV